MEIERVCNKAHEAVLETAAIGVQGPNGGPDQLVIVAVLKKGNQIGLDELQKIFSLAVSSKLNILFKVLIYSVPCCKHTCACLIFVVTCDKFILLVVLGASWYLRGTLVNSSNRFLLGSTKLSLKGNVRKCSVHVSFSRISFVSWEQDLLKLFNGVQVSAVAVVPEFPRTASNKVMRQVLRSQFTKKMNPSMTSKL